METMNDLDVTTTEELSDLLTEHTEMFLDEHNPEDVQYMQDQVFAWVDEVLWSDVVGQTGMINNLGSYPMTSTEREWLMSALTILEYADRQGWLAQDSGLWEGMDGWEVIMAQAFHSLENLFVGELREQGIDV